MEWFTQLFTVQSVAQSVLIIALTIALGIQLGKLKIGGISLGVTFILFVGILFGELGWHVNHEVLHFFKEFGLILFVYSIGMAVGPSFFSNFKKGGVFFNILAGSIVLLGALTTLAIHYMTKIPIPTMVGIMSGAITNTPGLGAAQQAYTDATGAADPTIAMGYAVAYPLGVVGIILSLILIRVIFRVRLEEEQKSRTVGAEEESHDLAPLSLLVTNPALNGRTIVDVVKALEGREFVVSRHFSGESGKIEVATGQTVLHTGDKLFVIARQEDVDAISTIVGEQIQMDRKQWVPAHAEFVSRQILVTNGKLSGKKIADLQLRKLYGVNLTRLTRSGIDLVASPDLYIQVGDKLTIVGSEPAIAQVEKIMGNKVKHLHEPNLFFIFIGIALGIILGSIPILIPGIPQPIKLGLAGGPLVISILISSFGYRFKMVTYTTHSATLLMREIGISIFLACVGIGAGNGFIDTIANQGGWQWIGYGFIITVVPLLIIGTIARGVFKVNYLKLMGLIAGSTTDPPALAYANSTAANDDPAIAYATVYPLTMFLRVVVAQLMILLFI
ncbi:MAG: putative transporter [Porphyromonas sp.]|nr:putative transporter [Porphyromonas sp.]